MATTRIVTAALLGAAAACGITDSRDSSNLAFEIREGYYVNDPPPAPQIVLLVETETQFPCMNYGLESDLVIAGTVLRVNASNRITKPEVCLTAIGPAGYRVALPVGVGSYTLEFVRDGVIDRYGVTITDAAIEITIEDAHFTHPKAVSFPRGS
jgi:hypothetical protein